MIESTKCPICDKIGISDFLSEDVVCSCCGSDLSVYRKVIWLFSFIQNQKNLEKQYTNRIENLERVNLTLSDSIQALNQELITTSTKIHNKDGVMIYVVKRGDGFCKISQRLYGTESRYQEIINMNNLKEQTNLHPGDTLIVNAH